MDRKTAGLIVNVFYWAAIGLGFFYIMRRWPDPEQWLRILSPRTLAGALCLAGSFVAAMVVRGVRWAVLMRNSYRLSMRKAVSVYGWNFVLMAFSPMRLGDLSRAVWIKNQGGSSVEAAGVLAAERLLDLGVLLLLFAVVASWAAPGSLPVWASQVRYVMLLTLALYGLFSLGTVLRKKLPARQYDPVTGRKVKYRALRAIDFFLRGVSCLSRPGIHLAALALSAGIWGLMAAGFCAFFSFSAPGIPLVGAVAVLVAVNLSNLIAVAPGNIGLYEMAAVVVLVKFGMNFSDALVTAVGLHLTVLVMAVAYGLACKVLDRPAG